MYLRIDPSSGIPLGLQITTALRLALAQGRMRSGQRLPSARNLAEQLQVNYHTVRKAYGKLEVEGLLEFRRGMGTYVAKRQRRIGAANLRRIVRSHMEALMQDLAGLDVDENDLGDLLHRELERVAPKQRRTE